MGGDYGPSVVVPAALQVLAKHERLHLILVGDQTVLQSVLSQEQNPYSQRLMIQHASQRVEMDDLPAFALRTKKDSSMRVAINLVKEGKAKACVSAGNTGALMATGHFVLKTIPGIDRAAIVSKFPTINRKRNMRLLDLGANVDSSAENLFQFAVMGSVLVSAIDNIDNPKVCLLNIGEEAIKGNEQVKQTAQLLANSNIINYSGYIEGDKIYNGEMDVAVCDGFVGNVALKISEGTAMLIIRALKEAFSANFLFRCIALLSMPILKSVIKRIDPDRYNGACFIGLRGIVIKSHGNATVRAFTFAIEEAIMQVQKNIPERIGQKVEHLLRSTEQCIIQK